MGSSFCLWHQMGGIGMDGANKNVGAEGLLKILRCGLERSAEQRTAIQLGDRSQYVGMSDIAKMLDCPRAALAGKLYIPEYRSTDEALKHKITFHRGHWFERGVISPLSTGNRDQIRGCAHQGSSGFHAGDRSTTTDSTDSGSQIHSKATDNPF